MSAVWSWLNANVVGNLVASFTAWLIAGSYVWFRHLRPHLKAQRLQWEWEAQHHSHVHDWFIDVHERLDAAGVPDFAAPHGVHSTESVAAASDDTGFLPTVGEAVSA